MRQGFIPLVVIVVVSTLVGCSSSTALEGEKFYIQSGIGRAFLPRDIAAVNEAARAALHDDLGFEIVSYECGADSGLVVARGSRARTVKIKTWSQGENETKMQISMGIGRSDLVIRDMMSKIEARLQ